MLLINIAKYVEKTINGKRDSERVVEAYYVDLEAGKVIDFQQGGKKLRAYIIQLIKNIKGKIYREIDYLNLELTSTTTL